MTRAKTPGKDTLAFADKLRAFLDQPWPPAHIDRAAHDHRLNALHRLIVDAGGSWDYNGAVYSMRLHGFRATSTNHLASACRNWITQVVLKSAAATMAGDRT